MSIKSYRRGAAVQLTANFKSTEFDCKDGKVYYSCGESSIFNNLAR